MASTVWFCIVVQWENENTVSVVNEKQVVGDVELTEGIIVDVLIGQSKGRLAIYKATILQVFGKYSLCHTQITSSSYIIKCELLRENFPYGIRSNGRTHGM